MTLGENFWARGPATVADSGKSQDFDGAGAVRQPPDEAALLERHDQAVDARLRTQVQGVLHFVERRGHPGLLQALMNEAQ